MISTNLPPILHRFGVIAFQISKKSLYFATPLAFQSPDLRKMFSECQWMAKVLNGEEKNAENFNRLKRLHERYRHTDDRQTDGTAIAYSERFSSNKDVKLQAIQS